MRMIQRVVKQSKSFFVAGLGGLCFGTQSIRGIIWSPGCVNSSSSSGGPEVLNRRVICKEAQERHAPSHHCFTSSLSCY